MTSSKTISTSTLSLRFMQKAHRAQNIAEVQAVQASVRDDAEWEVAPAVRAAWRATAEPNPPAAHEPSYLPFLFPAAAEDAPAVQAPRGRRIFNSKGEEAPEAPPAPLTPETPTPAPTLKASARLTSISGSSTPSKVPPRKSARAMVHDNAGVGADLRARPAPSATATAPVSVPAATGFLRPAGVDAPASKADVSAKADAPSGGDDVIVARAKKNKRTREALDGGTVRAKKRKSAE